MLIAFISIWCIADLGSKMDRKIYFLEKRCEILEMEVKELKRNKK